ncbi:MAG: hypothetical protein H0W71_04365 [Sphingomonas sp.]|nr:hypothetical protein [Sphingomonas sp.]
MRKLLGTIVLAAAALVAPRAAHPQSFPAPLSWGFGYEKFGEVRFLKSRLEAVQGRIRQMDYQHQLTGRSMEPFIAEADAIQRHLRNDATSGLTTQQAEAVRARIIKLEREVDSALVERGRRLQSPYAYANDDWRRDAAQDLDRNGTDDRWEDDWRVDTPVITHR